jgi:hypothetical protein
MVRGVLLKTVSVLVAAIIVISGGWSLYTRDTAEEDNGSSLPPVDATTVPFQLVFEDPSYEPAVLGFTLPLRPDALIGLEDIIDSLGLTDDQLEFLMANGMVGVAGPSSDFETFHSAYEWIEETEGLPTFITSDSVLDAYHLLFDRMLQILEYELLYDQVKVFSRRMMELSNTQRGDLSSEHKHLAEWNVVFFGTALRLLDPKADVPSYAEAKIETFVALVEEAKGLATPPGFKEMSTMGLEDFTQYKPRGHYTNSEKLSRYFRAMMIYGRLTFAGRSDDLTRRALLISYAIDGHENVLSAHIRVASVLRFIVGAPDDLTFKEYRDTADQVFGPMGKGMGAIFDNAKLTQFREEIKDLRPPRIESGINYEDEVMWGLCVFGQGLVIDSYVFENCVYSKVPDRFIPSAIDVMAALGSKEAWEREPFEDFNPLFEENMEELRAEFEGYTEEDWASSLYLAWLHTLQALHEDTSGQGYPRFMRTDGWEAKQLNTQLGSWTQLTHDTILYRKQSYTDNAYGMSGPWTEFTYVEPVPRVYSRLGDMVSATLTGLEELSLVIPDITSRLTDLVDRLDCLERVAIAELEGTEPNPDDLLACRYMYEITIWEGSDDQSDTEVKSKTVVVSDVPTDPNEGVCLQEGVGYVKFMIAVVPTDDGPVPCVGPIFQHHEFVRSLSEGRLTDEEWKSMLDEGTAPDPAPWAQDFIV